MKPLNPFIIENGPKIELFFDQLTSVDEPVSLNTQSYSYDTSFKTLKVSINLQNLRK